MRGYLLGLFHYINKAQPITTQLQTKRHRTSYISHPTFSRAITTQVPKRFVPPTKPDSFCILPTGNLVSVFITSPCGCAVTLKYLTVDLPISHRTSYISHPTSHILHPPSPIPHSTTKSIPASFAL